MSVGRLRRRRVWPRAIRGCAGGVVTGLAHRAVRPRLRSFARQTDPVHVQDPRTASESPALSDSSVSANRCAVGSVGGEHAVVADPTRTRRWDQRDQPLEQLAGLEDDVRGAVAPAALERVAEPAVRSSDQSRGGNRWASDVAAQALQSLAVPRGDADVGVQTDAVDHGAARAPRPLEVVGRDAISDPLPSAGVEGWPIPVHQCCLVAMGVHLLDNLELGRLAAACAARERWEFLFTVAPLRIERATGSPVNPVAVFRRGSLDHSGWSASFDASWAREWTPSLVKTAWI